MKKILTVWVLCILLLGFAAVSVPAAETEIPMGETDTILSPLPGEVENLLVNGDFEVGENGKAEKWNSKLYGETAGAWLIAGDMAKSGNSIRLTGGEGTASYPFVQQSIPVEGGATYQLSLWLRKDSGKASATTKLEFYASAVTGTVCVQGANTYTITKTNGWEQVLYNFRAPFTATSVLIMPRIESESEMAYYDDVKVYKVGPPSPVNLTTDCVFYYPEQKTGKAELSVSEIVLPDAADGTAVFSILDGSSVLHTETVPLEKRFNAEFSFDTALLSEYKKEYAASVIVKDKNGDVLCERKQPVYRFARPRYLDKNGVWNDGSGIFTPVIAYKVPPTDAAYIKCKKAGITVVQGDVGDLARANSHGLKVLVTLYSGMQPAGAEVNREKTKEIVEKYKNDSRVFAWAVMDEPHLNLPEPMESLRESYRIIREIDDNHPVYICEASPQHFVDSAKVCDLLCTDPYLPGSTTVPGKMNTTHVYDYVQRARAASGYLKPVLCLAQAFTWYRYLPDGDAERHMIYQALLAGATAHGYYNLAQAAEVNGEKIPLYSITSTDIWDGICSFASNEQADAYAHFVAGKYSGYSYFVGKDILYYGYVKNGKLRMIVLNQSITETVQAEIPLISFDGSKKIGAYTAKYIAGEEGSFSGEKSLSLTLSPYKAVVLEVTASGVSLEGLSADAFRAHVENIRRKKKEGVTNGSMEVLKNGIPTDFTFSGTHSADGTTVYEGKYSLCLAGAAFMETEVQVEAGKAQDVWAYVKHTGSARLSVFCEGSLWGETEEIQGDGLSWQKLMVTLPPQKEASAVTIRITHSESGAAYIDNVEIQSTKALIRNGSFEGKTAQNTPAGGWRCTGGFGASADAGLVTENEGQILKVGGTGEETSVETDASLTEGNLYVLELDARGSGAALEINGVTNLCQIGISPAGAETWVENLRYYFTAPETKSYVVRLYSFDGIEAYFDNVSLRRVYSGEVQITAWDGKICAETAHAYDGTTEEITFALCAFTEEGKLLDIAVQKRETAYVPLVDETVRNTTETGEKPALFSLSLPESDETACYKAFVWKGLVPVLSEKVAANM